MIGTAVFTRTLPNVVRPGPAVWSGPQSFPVRHLAPGSDSGISLNGNEDGTRGAGRRRAQPPVKESPRKTRLLGFSQVFTAVCGAAYVKAEPFVD